MKLTALVTLMIFGSMAFGDILKMSCKYIGSVPVKFIGNDPEHTQDKFEVVGWGTSWSDLTSPSKPYYYVLNIASGSIHILPAGLVFLKNESAGTCIPGSGPIMTYMFIHQSDGVQKDGSDKMAPTNTLR